MGKKRKKSNQLQTYYISKCLSVLINEHYKHFKNNYFNSFDNYFNTLTSNISESLDEKEVYKIVDNLLLRQYLLIFTHSSLTDNICLADVSGKEE